MADGMAARSAWADLWLAERFGPAETPPGVVVTEPRRCAAATLAARNGRAGDLIAAVAQWGVDLPRRPAWAAGSGFTFIWTGPDQWLVRGGSLFADIEAEFSGVAAGAVLVDQSDARAVLSVGGRDARATLAKGFEIDLHPRAFRTGDAAVTVAAGISALLWQTDDRPTFEIAVPRSMAGSFWHWFTVSAAPFGCRVERAA